MGLFLLPFLFFYSLAGVSRSVTLTAAYLSTAAGLSHQARKKKPARKAFIIYNTFEHGLAVLLPNVKQESLQAVRSARTSASPNIGFQRQLLEFEQHGALGKERRRLEDKFRVRPALSARGGRRAGSRRLPATPPNTSSCSPNTAAASSSASSSSVSSTEASSSSSSSNNKTKVRPPLIQNAFIKKIFRSTQVPPSVPESDNLTLGDAARCADLLRRYRRLVLGGEICGGDCPDGGVACPSGICRAHLR